MPRCARPRARRSRPGCRSAPTRGVGCVLLDPDGTAVARGVPPRRRHPARRGRRAGPRRRPGPRGHRRRHPRAVRPHRPHRPLLPGADRRRGGPGGLRPGRPQPGRGRRRGPRCARPASTSRAACWPRRPRAVNRAWTFAVEHGRPFVTWKFADHARRPQRRRRRHAAAGSPRRPARARRPRAARPLRRDPRRHRHRARRRPAADRPRRATTATCPATGSRCGW